jgi:hypothetical protein
MANIKGEKSKRDKLNTYWYCKKDQGCISLSITRKCD